MKRTELLKKLAMEGFEFKEGSNHTKVYKDGVYTSVIGRHKEIGTEIVKAIEKQTKTKLIN